MCLAETRLEGEDVEFWLFDVQPDEICGSSLEAVEEHALWVELNWKRESGGLIQYELFDVRQRCWPCPDGAGACAEAGRLGTTRLPDRHEVAHAARGMSCTSLIEEGWATLYSNPFEGGEIIGTLEQVASGIEDEGRLPGEYYPFAARFVAFVLEGWGLDAIHALCDRRLASVDELEEGLGQVLGLSLTEVQNAIDDYPNWSLGQLRQDQACEQDASVSVPTSLTIEIGCSAEGAEGLLGHSAWNGVVVDFGEGGSYELTLEPVDPLQDIDVWVEIRSCAREGLASLHYDLDVLHPKSGQPAGALLSNLPPGPHVIRVLEQASVPDRSLELSISPWP